MTKLHVNEGYYKSAKAELLRLQAWYEDGEITDEELCRAENTFYTVEQEYLKQLKQKSKRKKPVNEEFPNADREQWLFDYLCEQVGKMRQDHGEHALSEQDLDLANRRAWKVIRALEETWDKGDIYYPHPKNPDLRQALVRDLRDKDRRRNARRRNRSDMAHGRPYRGPGALMMDPPKKEKK